MTSLIFPVRYHVVIRNANAGNGGPGNEKFELTPEVKNLVWQKALNLPGNAAFTLMRHSRRLPDLDFMQQHVEIYREDRSSIEAVFRGKIVQPDYGPSDVVILCWDYQAFLQRVRIDYYLNNAKKRYKHKKIGTEVVEDLFDRSIDSDSVLAFVTKGTIQNPKADDETTIIKTSNSFGFGNLENLLTVFYDMAEMAMTNTDNTVVFEIDDDNQFNFWRDRRFDKDGLALVYPGNIKDYSAPEGWGATVNDMATLVRNKKKPTSKSEIKKVTTAGARGVDTVRRLQSAVKLGTFAGISSNTKKKGKKQLALLRIAKAAIRLDRAVTIHPHEGVFTGYPSLFNLGHNLYVHIEKEDGGYVGQYLKLQSIVGAWSAQDGESIAMGFREKEAPDP